MWVNRATRFLSKTLILSWFYDIDLTRGEFVKFPTLKLKTLTARKWRVQTRRWYFRHLSPPFPATFFLPFTTFHHLSPHFATFRYLSLPFTTFHYLSLPFATFHYLPLPCTTFRYLSLPFATFRYLSLHFATFHYFSLPFATFRYFSLPFTTVHYLSLPFHYLSATFSATSLTSRPKSPDLRPNRAGFCLGRCPANRNVLR